MEIQSQLLNLLAESDHPIDGSSFDSTELVRVLSGLSSKEIVSFESLVTESWVLTDEGKDILNKGSHEAQVYNAIPAGNSISVKDLAVIFFLLKLDNVGINCKVWSRCCLQGQMDW